MRADHEALRARHRPEKVAILFVGESPPASRRFFYNRDSGLYRAMLNAFQLVDSTITDDNFLDIFQKSGCYLTDVCRRPVDRLEKIARHKACMAGERHLAEKICDLQPSIIITFVRSIQKNVENAVSIAGWHGTLLNTPYPGRWVHHKKIFVQILVPQLQVLLKPRP
jgi:hypothetical protein